jgi:HSP20 family protein
MPRSNEFYNYLNQFARTENNYTREKTNFPAVNIIEEPKSFQLQLAAPGYTKQDFSLNIEKNMLTISANLNEEELKEVNFITKEFSKSSFSRTFTLGKSVDTSNIEASYKDGVLNVTLSKNEEAIEKPPRSINVS